jgi:hypothetical protein
MIPVSAPKGLPLVAQAMAYAGAARITEFAPPRSSARPAQFPMIDVLAAIHRGEGARKVAAIVALQEFLRAPRHLQRRFRSRITELITAGDFPADATMQAYIDKFLITAGEMDIGYEELFATHDVATSEAQLKRSSFKVLNVTSGVTFKKRLPGQPVEFRRVEGAEVETPYEMWGGGVSIDRVWWDDQDYLTIGEMLQMFREAAYEERAAAIYGLITSLSNAINYTTGADLIAKLNGACATILRAVKGKGYGATPTTSFVLMYAPEKAGEVDAALATQSDVAMQTATSKTRVQYRFRRVPTTHVPATGSAAGIYVILPKRQLKCGYRMDLTLFGQFSVASYADDIAGFHRFGAIVGDTDQIRRIP